ncbi:MAG: septum formation initiator family protein [Roseiflexaceae bacterium]|nr:septum formation initiator family protein [Roseiflexaceae bacterium]
MSHRRQTRASLTPTLPPRMRVGQSGAILISVGLVAISCWMLAGLIGQVLTGAQIDRQHKELKVDIARIERENADLKRQLTYAESPAYAEQVAREQLGMAREGDTVILPTFPDTAPASVTATAIPLPTPIIQSNWQGWQEALFPSTGR